MANPAENNVKNESPAQENKMGVMPVGKLLFTMSLPIMISMLVQALYNVVDSMFVARVSENALTALSMAFPIQNLMIAVSAGLGVGLNAVLSRALGAKDEKGVNRAATNGIMLLFICGLVFMLGGATIVRPYFEMQTDIAEIVESGVDYTTIVMLGSMGIFMQILFERLLQSTGRTLLTMVSQGVGAIANIILDPIFIFALNMGTAGAALATALSQVVSFVILLMMCNTKADALSIRFKNFKPSLKIYGSILYNGVPSLGRQGIASVATIIMNIMAQPYGDAAIAAMSIVNRFMMFVGSAMIGFGQGFQPVCSYCFGAGMYRRVKEACVFCIKVSTAVLFVFAVIGLIFSGNIVAVFRKDDMDVIRIGTLALRLQLCTLPLMGITVMGNMTPQSMGYGTWATVVSTSRQGWFLIPLLLFLTPAIGILGIQIAQPLADIGTTILAIWALRLIFKDLLLKEEMSE